MAQGWNKESERHKLAGMGIPTKQVATPKSKFTRKQQKMLKDIKEQFEDWAKNVRSELHTSPNEPIALTYGMIPTFRNFLTPEQDKEYMWGGIKKGQMTTYTQTDFKKEVEWAFEDALNSIEEDGNVVFGDEGDGTVIHASTQAWYEKNMGDGY
jgi:hypothetical protein